MALDLTQLAAQLENQLADLSRQRTEIQKELDAILLVERASHRADSFPLEQEAVPAPSPIDPEPTPPVIDQAEEAPVQEETAPVVEPATEPVEAAPQEELAAESIEAPPQEEMATEPVEAVPVEDPVADPVTAAPQEEVAAEPVESVPVEEPVAEPVAAASQEEAPAAEEPAQSEPSPESTTEIKDRRNQLEETVMALELNDEVAVLELLKMFHKSLSPGKIADEVVAVNWNFQGQHPRAAVNAALHKMVNEGKVQQVNGGDYGVSI